MSIKPNVREQYLPICENNLNNMPAINNNIRAKSTSLLAKFIIFMVFCGNSSILFTCLYQNLCLEMSVPRNRA